MDYKIKLKEYTSGKLKLTPILNIMMNERTKNWYSELGKYIAETLDIEKIPHLKYFADKLKERDKSIIKKINFFRL